MEEKDLTEAAVKYTECTKLYTVFVIRPMLHLHFVCKGDNITPHWFFINREFMPVNNNDGQIT